jgi:hypothetical protein
MRFVLTCIFDKYQIIIDINPFLQPIFWRIEVFAKLKEWIYRLFRKTGQAGIHVKDKQSNYLPIRCNYFEIILYIQFFAVLKPQPPVVPGFRILVPMTTQE